MTKKIVILVMVISLSLGLSSLVKPADTPELESPDEFTLIGKVVYIPLEGGFYGIEELTSGNKYLPLNLPATFQKAGIEVQVQAKKVKDMSGIHLWGKYIYIQTIEPSLPPATP